MSAPETVSSLLPQQNIDAFRRLVRNASRENLRRNVDVYLQQADQAQARGDLYGAALARKKWNIAWDEIERRDGIPGEVAS
jgi:hypothetical protein